jgi:hypothetical protein
MNAKKILILLAHALVGWAFCGGIIGVGFTLWSEQTTLVVHAFFVPLVFLGISWNYFTRFAYTTPLTTALAFLGVVVFMDTVVVSMLIQGTFEMFSSLIGTWIPLASIFLVSYVTGKTIMQRRQQQIA